MTDLCIRCDKPLPAELWVVCWDCAGVCINCGKEIRKDFFRCTDCYLKGKVQHYKDLRKQERMETDGQTTLF